MVETVDGGTKVSVVDPRELMDAPEFAELAAEVAAKLEAALEAVAVSA